MNRRCLIRVVERQREDDEQKREHDRLTFKPHLVL